MDPRAGRGGGEEPGKFFAGVRDGLIAHAGHLFRLSARIGEGDDESTLRDHLEAAALQGSEKAAAELEPPELPEAGAHVWAWFLELDHARGSNGWGPNPIGYGDIAAWARLTGRRPAIWEIEILRALDRERMAASVKKKKPSGEKKP